MSKCELLEYPISQHRVLKERSLPEAGWVLVPHSHNDSIGREDEENWAFWLNAWDED